MAIKNKGFTTIRMYGTDCDGLQNIGAGCDAAGLKMIVGVFIEASGVAGAQSQVGDIATWGAAGNWAKVVLLTVGNEAINNKFVSAGDLAAFITSSKGAWQAAGSGSIPVTTSDTVNAFLANAATLCPVIDWVACNVEPFFDGAQTPDTVGNFMVGQFQSMEAACAGKAGYISLETGWPNDGGPNGQSVADSATQAAALAAIISQVGGQVVMFDFQNNAWQSGTPWDPHFGCFDAI
jgi:exo-beta-1,3-glucanase (GH17 family)